MSWVDEIKKVPTAQLGTFSRTGEIVAAESQSGTGFAGTQSQIYVREDDGTEFAVRASASALGRPGHRLSVVYLNRRGDRSGYDVAYYNHTMRQLTYDKLVSGATDGSHRADLNGPPVAEGCLAAIGGLVSAALLTSMAGFVFGAVTPVVFFILAGAVLYVLLRKYAFKDGENRIGHIRKLVEDEVSRARGAN